MTEDEMRSLIAATARPAVFFEPICPPPHDKYPTSFFGGRPLLPKEIEWPVPTIRVGWRAVHEGGKRALLPLTENVAGTFLGQVDLGALPTGADVTPLPRQGTLYFFFDSATGELILPEEPGTGGKVIYWDGNSSECNERDEPESLRACYGDDADSHFEWLKAAQQEGYGFPRSFAKWAVRPTVANTYAARYPDAKAPFEVINKFHQLEQAMQEEQLRAVFQEVERNYAPWTSAPRGAWRGGPGFPYAWLCIEIFAGMMLQSIGRHGSKHPERKQEFRLGELELQCLDWLKRARTTGQYVAVSAADRSEFWSWYEGVVNSSDPSPHQPRHWVQLQECLARAYKVGPRLCMAHSADAARLIPSLYIEDQRWQFAVNLAGWGGRFVQHRLLGASSDAPTPEHTLLMRFDSQEGLDWLWCDVGVVEYWVKRQDLETLHFDDVIVRTFGS